METNCIMPFKVVSVCFIKRKYSQQYRWVNESFYYKDSLGNSCLVCKWVQKRLITCPASGEYWADVAIMISKHY